jgi:hypothetical protein
MPEALAPESEFAAIEEIATGGAALAVLEEIAAQVATTINVGTRQQNGHRRWGLSPNIARAKVAREPKPAAPKPAKLKIVPAKPAAPAPSLPLAGRVLATFADYDGMHAAIRARADELSLTREDLDWLSGNQSGYSATLLAPRQAKRFGWQSLGSTTTALGCFFVLIEDPVQTAKMLARVQKRKRGSHGARRG